MSRAIKFRAWDGKQMLVTGDYWNAPNRQKGNSSLCYPIKVTNLGIVWCKRYPTPMPDDAMEIDQWVSRDIVLMQFTGLTDKNGKDIYEGDIVQHYDHGGELVYGVVAWDTEDASFTPGVGLMSEASSWLEVVGNMYENPNLLEQSHG